METIEIPLESFQELCKAGGMLATMLTTKNLSHDEITKMKEIMDIIKRSEERCHENDLLKTIKPIAE